MTTMNDRYGDGSAHACCQSCDYCKTCGDCERYGCGRHERTITSESGEPKAKADRVQEDSVSNRAAPADRIAGWCADDA